MPGNDSLLDDFDPGELGDEAYHEDLFKPLTGPCVGCKNSGKWCDQNQPCGNCSVEFKTCVLINQQPFPGQQNTPACPPGTFGTPPSAGTGGEGVEQNAFPGSATQRLLDMLPSTGLGITVPQQQMQPGVDLRLVNVHEWMNGTLPDSPEQGERTELFQQASVPDPFVLGPYQAIPYNPNHGPETSERQPFQEVRNQNTAQQQYESSIQPDERAVNALVQNYHVQGGSPLEVIESIIQSQGIIMRNVDDQTIAEGRDPALLPLSGPVLPAVGVPAHRAYVGAEACEDFDGCHESDGYKAMEGIAQLCRNHPTKPCSVFNHGKYCVCVDCRATQDRFANGSSPDNPGQQEVIDGTKSAYCVGCAQVTKTELQHGNIDIRINTCLCTGQMTKACMCSLHRQQAKMLVRRRTLLMRDWATRSFQGGKFGNNLPCARCALNIPDANSGVWQCVACNERVVKWVA